MEPAGTIGVPEVTHLALNGVYFNGWTLHRRPDVVWDFVKDFVGSADVGYLIIFADVSNVSLVKRFWRR